MDPELGSRGGREEERLGLTERTAWKHIQDHMENR